MTSILTNCTKCVDRFLTNIMNTNIKYNIKCIIKFCSFVLKIYNFFKYLIYLLFTFFILVIDVTFKLLNHRLMFISI